MKLYTTGFMTLVATVVSLVVACLMYALAWTNFGYAWILILLCGVSDAYFTRKRAGLVKRK